MRPRPPTALTERDSGRPGLAWTLPLLATAVLAACTPGQRPAQEKDRSLETSRQALAVLSPGFQETTVLANLTAPTAVRFAADGRIFVAEKRGRVLVYDGLADTTPTEFARLDTSVHDYWDRGLLGLALHPQFPAQPFVYVLYALDAPVGGTPPVWNDECPDPPGATDHGCVIGARLSRLEADGNVSKGETVLLESWGQQYPSHSIGDLTFGADGALYASSGDGASFGFVDYGQRGRPANPLGDPPAAVGGAQTPPTAQGGALRSQSLRRPAGPATLHGTIVRLDPLTGDALPTNPLFANPDLNARRIVAYGLRNPFRFTTRPGTSELWVGDVGLATWEEINRVLDPADAVVENFGWPCYEGRERQPGYDGANLELCEQLYQATDAVSAPFFTYNHASRIVPGEKCGVGSSATTALAFYTGDKYPPKYKGALFFGDYSRECAWVMLPGADGVPDPTKIETFGVDFGKPVDFQMAPDGYLYYVDVGAGEIRRITYLLSKAVASGTPLVGSPPLVVSFDGSASTPPLPGDSLSFAWDLDGDGQFDDATEPQPSVVYDTTGTRAVRLQVTDQRGVAVVSDPLSVVVSDTPITSTPPVPVIDTPATTLRWKVGDVISFSGKATDAEDGALPASALTWLLVMQHCPAGCHSHVVQRWTGTAGASFTAPDHEFPSHVELVLVATDASGVRRSASVRLEPATVFVTMQSQPPGLTLALGLEGTPAPFGREMIFGGRTSVGASLLQTLGPQTYAFVGWEGGQPASHDLGPLTTDQRLVATYRPAGLTAQYFSDLELTQPVLTRIDPEIDFDWERDAPDPSLPESFSARWTGFVLPPATDLYTFYTDSDDGIRVWVNGYLIIDNWTRHSATRDRGIVPLLGGIKARVRVEFFDDQIDALAKLYWSRLGAPTMAVVPAARLYPACLDGACPNGLACMDGECVSPCATACPPGQRCASPAGGCVDACKDVSCGRGRCVAGLCQSRCQGVSCPAGLTCTPETGMCEDLACREVTCSPGKTCVGGACKAVCEVSGCSESSKCNLDTGACEPRCTGVTCGPGLACLPSTGACVDACQTMTCPGQACQAGECKPICVVEGCASTESCNATTGRCEAKCAQISCAAGAVCVPTTGECQPCSAGSCPAADGGTSDGGLEPDAGPLDAPGAELDADPAPADAGAVDGGGPGVPDGSTRDGAGDGAAGGDGAGPPRPLNRNDGGCGCNLGGQPRPGGGAAGALLLLLAVIAGKRRRPPAGR